MQGTHAQLDPNQNSQQIPIIITFCEPCEVLVEDDSVPMRKRPDVRIIRISQGMRVKYGYTEGCDGCRQERQDYQIAEISLKCA